MQSHGKRILSYQETINTHLSFSRSSNYMNRILNELQNMTPLSLFVLTKINPKEIKRSHVLLIKSTRLTHYQQVWGTLKTEALFASLKHSCVRLHNQIKEERHHSGGGWWLGNLAVVEVTMNSYMWQSTLESNMGPSVQQLNLNQNWIIKQDNDPKQPIRIAEKEKNQVTMCKLKF